MRSQKRSHANRAFYRGYLAATENRPLESCPHTNGSAHQEWVNGWREGREDYWQGFDQATVAQKLELYRAVSHQPRFPDGWSTS